MALSELPPAIDEGGDAGSEPPLVRTPPPGAMSKAWLQRLQGVDAPWTDARRKKRAEITGLDHAPIVLASVTAVVAARALISGQGDLHSVGWHLASGLEIALHAALGVAAGACALLYVRAIDFVHDVFDGFSVPFVYAPGDNEWSDCPEPAERLAAIRHVFFSADQSLGRRRIALTRQAAPSVVEGHGVDPAD